MVNLKRNWLVSSKFTQRIWQSLARALKNLENLHFNGLLLNSIYNVWAKKGIGELCLMELNTDTTFEGKLTCAFKNETRNYSKFSPEHVWNSKNWKFDGIVLSKVENIWTENLQGSFVSWQWRRIPNLNRNWLVSSKLTWRIWQILTRALENLKNLTFNGLLLSKVYNVWPKKVQGIYVW